MKIENYKKKKSNIYELTLSNKNKIYLYDDVILKYELLLKKEISDKELKDIIKFNNFIESYNVAIKYINTKHRTKKEIRKKLANYDEDAINYTINRLINEKYINNELYIKAYINDEINLKTKGPIKILFDLKKLGFDETEILNYLNIFEKEIWLNKINKYITKKINNNHNLSGIILKQKLQQDLQNKGFYKEHINIILNEYEFNDTKEIYEKEYQKQKNKLSRKYNGEELEYRIKIALLKKGFKKN